MTQWLDTAGFWPRLALGVAAAAWLWIVACDVGTLLARRLLGRESSAAHAIAPALGYAAIGSIVALLGLVHSARPIWVIGLLAALTLARSFALARAVTRAPQWFGDLAAAWHNADVIDRAAYVVGGAGLVTALAAAALPAVWWDPIAYHLPLALRALGSGTFGFDPQMVQTAFPQLSEAAALPAYALAGSAGANMATLGAGIALIAVCARIAHKFVPGSGALAAALLATSPLVLWLAPSFYIDVPYALFVIAALATAWLDNVAPGEPGSVAIRGALSVGLASGLLAGAAAASKYPGLASAVIAAALLLITDRARWAGRLTGFVLGFLVIAAGWYARSWALSGDPIFPILAAHFGASAAVQDFAQRYVSMTRHWCGGGTSIADAVLLPWRLVTEPRSFCGDPGYALRLGAVCVAAAIAFVRQARAPGLVILVMTAVWFVTTQQWRFLLPALCLVAVVAAIGAVAAAPRLSGIASGVLLALCLLNVAADWLPALESEASNSIVPGYGYAAGAESGADYLRERLEMYAAGEWLAAHAPGAKTLALDEVRDYYFGPDIVWANPFYQSRWRIDWSAPPAQRYRPFREAGFAYMVVNANPAYVRRTPTGIDWNILAQDERLGVITRAFSANGVTVYGLAAAR